jgi:hypothetical protein
MIRDFTRWLLSPRQPLGIDGWIASVMGRDVVAHMQVYWVRLPDYRFVDLHGATERYCQAHGGSVPVESEHDEDLNNILHGRAPAWSSRQIKGASNATWSTGPGQEAFLPGDIFWTCPARSAPDGRSLVVRLRYESQYTAIVEAASDAADVAAQCVNAIVDDAAGRSIYRNQLLELTYDSPGRVENADVNASGRLRIGFKALEAVDEDDIVIEDDVRRMLSRNILDLFDRRDLLKRHGVPVRRGVLFFGPPGTGKTFACRYLCRRLPDTTRIVATGAALFQVGAIFALARMLQPTLVILEDVDLVFTARETNLYSSVLGDLLDHMDGLRPHEDIAFILTTNAIERLESAIKDRPGRISQIINFGPPGPQLRRRYLQHHLRAYDLRDVDLDRLAAVSVGGTQAFLKEWVHRAVQVATERLATDDDAIALEDGDFEDAMQEMRHFISGSSGRIIGFHLGDR